MRITKPMYSVSNKGTRLLWESTTKCADFALDFGPMVWVDSRYGVLKAQIPAYEVLLTQTDLVAHDDYMAQLRDYHVVVFYLDNTTKLGASRGRLKSAMEKLKAAGVKCRYFASRDSAEKFVLNYTSKIKRA